MKLEFNALDAGVAFAHVPSISISAVSDLMNSYGSAKDTCAA